MTKFDAYNMLGQCWLIMFLALSGFWFVKVALELNYGGALLTNSGEIVNILLNFFGVILFEVSYYMKVNDLKKEQMESYYYDSNNYINLETYALLDYLACISMCFSIIFYPFRFFTLLARFAWSKPILILLNAVYRTLPGVMLYLIMASFVTLGWVIAFYCIFGSEVAEAQTFWSTFSMLATLDIFSVSEVKTVLKEKQSLSGFALMLTIFQTVFVVFFIALVVHLYSQAI